MKRTGLFFADGRYGIINNYITFLLEDIDACLDTLIIFIYGGDLSDGEKEKVSFYADRVVAVPAYNKKSALRYALTDDMFLADIICADELVVFDDSFYGPFIPFADVFNGMSQSKANFWGISRRAAYHDKGEIVNEYLQRYFMVFRKEIIESDAFKSFVENGSECSVPSRKNDDFDDGLTWFLSNRGFTYVLTSRRFSISLGLQIFEVSLMPESMGYFVNWYCILLNIWYN